MNIFVTSPWPAECAIVLPDRHINKMALECCQMLSIVASDKWGHGYALCNEYGHRYGKIHSCLGALYVAEVTFMDKTNDTIGIYKDVKSFVRAMPNEYKLDTSIDTFTAYRKYIASKPWVASNYLRIPERKPDWI